MNSGFAEEQHPFQTSVPASAEDDAGLHVKLKVGPGGRIVIPAAVREALGIEEGTTLVARVALGELRIVTMRSAIEIARTIVREKIPPGSNVVDEFIAEKRREAERE